MSIKYIFFDLDGTLLPMDNELFAKGYFSLLVKKLIPYGYQKDELIRNIWIGTKAMVDNNGSRLNREAFWDAFHKIYGDKVFDHMPIFDDFYENDFKEAKRFAGFNEKSKAVIEFAKNLGFKLILATNPIFPTRATELRMAWAGLKEDDFEFFTTYDNSSFCKPNLSYYGELCQKLGINPTEVLMVGNDVDEDMIAVELGMQVFLLTDNLINKYEKDTSKYPKGNFDDLLLFLQDLSEHN